jgi:hypothetical protein
MKDSVIRRGCLGVLIETGPSEPPPSRVKNGTPSTAVARALDHQRDRLSLALNRGGIERAKACGRVHSPDWVAAS